MLETLAIAAFVVVVGLLLFLPTLATRWWQSRRGDEPDES